MACGGYAPAKVLMASAITNVCNDDEGMPFRMADGNLNPRNFWRLVGMGTQGYV